MPNLQIALYARVSTDQQARGNTVDSQVAALRDRIEELDWKVHDVVIAPVPELPPAQTFRSTLRTGPTAPPSVQ